MFVIDYQFRDGLAVERYKLNFHGQYAALVRAAGLSTICFRAWVTDEITGEKREYADGKCVDVTHGTYKRAVAN